jgi:3-oxoacyl-[acyl-carrier-protein] synthase-1
MERRIAITGCGVVSSIGNNCEKVLDSLRQNKSGIEFLPELLELGLNSCVRGTIKEIDIKRTRQAIGLKSRYMDLSALYAALAAQEAVADSRLSEEILVSDRTSCIVGSGVSNSDPLARGGQKVLTGKGRTTPFDVTRGMCSSCSANLAFLFGMKGRSYSISSACATSVHNIGHACELIQHGISDTVMTGGAEEVSSIYSAIFDGMRKALSTGYNDTPEKASRPYDIKRNGFVISGGAGIVILEELEHARKRKANIYGEIIGYGASSDGSDIIQPHPQGDGAYRCMQEAFAMQGISPREIDYVNTHGTGTPAGDISESLAIKNIFSDYKVPVSSTKSITGHGLGAAGAQELIYCLLMMKHGFISASMNIEEIDTACNHLNIVTENRQENLNKVLTNSFGFGGTNASLVIAKV